MILNIYQNWKMILFYGEEYLNTILKDCGYIHPQNKISKGRVSLFTDGSGHRYPDFYKEGIVLDAKYKRYAHMKLQSIDGDDLHQVITYMYILAANQGGFIVPWQHDIEDSTPQLKILNGYGGRMSIYGITVDTPANSFKSYCQQMAQFEREFVKQLPERVIHTVPETLCRWLRITYVTMSPDPNVTSPDDKQVKKAVFEVLEKHGVKVLWKLRVLKSALFSFI